MQADVDGAGGGPTTDAEVLADAVGELGAYGMPARLRDRLIVITEPVTGNPHLAVLQALGLAAKAAPVGAAAHGALGVAAAAWLAPDLFMARWSPGSRWVARYRFPSRGKPDDYLREATGIPSQLAKENWYGDVPDEVAEAFFAVGVLLDEPPFPPPPKPAPKPPPAAPARAARSSSPRAPSAPRAPRRPPAPRKAVPATRTCALCHLQKHVSQFTEGSDLCADCR